MKDFSYFVWLFEIFFIPLHTETIKQRTMATIKKLILLAITALVVVGCTDKNSDGSIKLSNGDCGISNNPNVKVIDSCEYIDWGYGLAHKGNCRFCKERRQKEFEELIIKLKENNYGNN